MRTILDTIIEHKRMEVLKRKARKPLGQLKLKPFYNREPLNPLLLFNENEPNIIAEYKRRSPSKGIISQSIDPFPVVQSYMKAGAMASSILTDRDFFGGSFRDLENVKSRLENFPLLRKDFMIDPYQLHEARAYGADMILLIASILEKSEIAEMVNIADGLGLSVLLEVHSEEELEKWVPGIKMVGVNNRDLKDFSVDVQRSVTLFPKLPAETFRISESGLKEPEDVRMLFNIGFRGFLMGERFMAAGDPGRALGEFMNGLKTL
jgi:indole-3-glycerol phosphate synthase